MRAVAAMAAVALSACASARYTAPLRSEMEHLSGCDLVERYGSTQGGIMYSSAMVLAVVGAGSAALSGGVDPKRMGVGGMDGRAVAATAAVAGSAMVAWAAKLFTRAGEAAELASEALVAMDAESCRRALARYVREQYVAVEIEKKAP